MSLPNPTRLREWAALLRGEFKDKQGNGCLRTEENTYCCLGVACEMHRRATSDGEWKHHTEGDGDDEYFYTYGGAGGSFPDKVAHWFGFCISNETPCSDPILDHRGPEFQQASVLNDGGKSFEYIADRIEHLAELIEANPGCDNYMDLLGDDGSSVVHNGWKNSS